MKQRQYSRQILPIGRPDFRTVVTKEHRGRPSAKIPQGDEPPDQLSTCEGIQVDPGRGFSRLPRLVRLTKR